jgi:hypothetical protein
MFNNSLKIGPNFFLQHSKKKFQFCEIHGYKKKGMKNFFFSPLSFIAVFVSRIRGPGPGWVKFRIRDTPSQPVGLVIFLGSQIFLCIFWLALKMKNPKVYADERINAEMKSLSILCVRR